MQLDGNVHEIVGIAPAWFYFPDRDAQLWTPYVPAVGQPGVDQRDVRRRAPEAGGHRGAGCGGRHVGGAQRDAADGRRVDVWQGRSRRSPRPAARGPDDGRDSAGPVGADGRSGAGAAHRVRQRGEPAARPRRREVAGARRSCGARRRPRPARAPAAHRECGAVGRRRRARSVPRLGVDACAAGVGARRASAARRCPARRPGAASSR